MSQDSHDTHRIAERLADVVAKIDHAVRDATGQDNQTRDPVTLVAVSKTKPADEIIPVLKAGHRVFGENKVQEATQKWPQLREAFPDIELRLIGHLQTNKVKDAINLFDVIETVDRPKLARALATAMKSLGCKRRCLIQVNTGEEEQKSGVWPEEADRFIALCREDLALPVEGLMCIPPHDENPAPHFALLGEIAKRNRLNILSMGMSADYETAIRFGATHVRVGTAIFGPRS